MTTAEDQRPLQAQYEKGQSIEVTITDAAEVEKCFGRMENGVAVFVRGHVAVDDRVEAEIYKIKKKYLEARLVRVIERSPHRVKPTCSHFGVCGGCKWQHVSYEEQLRIKRKQVQDALRHLGGFDDVVVRDVLPAPSPFGYRNKVDFSFSDRRFLLPDEIDLDPEQIDKPVDFALGFHAPLRYSKAIDIDYCFLATPEMNRVLEVVRGFCLVKKLSVYSTRTHQGFLRNLVVRQSEATGDVMVNLVTTWRDETCMAELGAALRESLGHALGTFVNNVTDRKSLVAYGDEEFPVLGTGTITERLGDFEFEISANSFFQTNSRQALALYRKVMDMSGLAADDVAYDLYCGAGTISLFLAQTCDRVLGTDVVETAIRDAEANARRNKLSNCSFHLIDMMKFKSMASEWDEFGRPDVVVTDPPRAGMHPKAVKGLLGLSPRRIVYVSCKPASLARDARALCDGGTYRLVEVAPIDMFPQTSQIESVAVLERTSPGTVS